MGSARSPTPSPPAISPWSALKWPLSVSIPRSLIQPRTQGGWLDLTEWFDGNDYNPTPESSFRLDDETYDASEDVATDSDSDWDYGYDNDDTSDDEGSASSSLYGFDDRYLADNWFYDYCDEGYLSYVDVDGDGNYEYYTAWYDYDGDGFYDCRVFRRRNE